MSSYKVEPVANSATNILGEGPHWDVKSQNLYYVDISKGLIFRLDFATKKIYEASIDGEPKINFIIPVIGTTNEFAVGLVHRLCVIEWDGSSPKCKILRTIAEFDAGLENNTLNDSKADPRGRFFGGTFNGTSFETNPRGSFYTFEKGQKEPKCWMKSIGISNGLTWDLQLQKFYYIDSPARDVKAFDYDIETGVISNGCKLIDLSSYSVETESPALPDGMTIDTDGFLYVALFNGSAVLKINPRTSKVEQKIEIPAKQVTSVAFGGPNLDILYVTTANLKMGTTEMSSNSELAGKLFEVTGLGAKGTTMYDIDL